MAIHFHYRLHIITPIDLLRLLHSFHQVNRHIISLGIRPLDMLLLQVQLLLPCHRYNSQVAAVAVHRKHPPHPRHHINNTTPVYHLHTLVDQQRRHMALTTCQTCLLVHKLPLDLPQLPHLHAAPINSLRVVVTDMLQANTSHPRESVLSLLQSNHLLLYLRKLHSLLRTWLDLDLPLRNLFSYQAQHLRPM